MSSLEGPRPLCLRFREVSFSYGDLRVLEKVSFHIHQGEFIALVGPNGSGKTTVLKLILGLERPQAGTVELFGGPSTGAKDRVGYVPQQADGDRAFPITVEEVVKMGRLRPFSRKYRGEDRAAAEEALEELGIADLGSRPFRALSGGQRRRVLVARALAARPDFLILDEPTANMDQESEERLFRTLGNLKGKAAILIVTHNMDFVSPLTGRLLCMGRGASDAGGGIVRHPLETEPLSGESRVIHEERLPADRCYQGEEPL